jgi:hypothetical protein
MMMNKTITTREKKINNRDGIKVMHQKVSKNKRQIVGGSVRHLQCKKNRCITELKKGLASCETKKRSSLGYVERTFSSELF